MIRTLLLIIWALLVTGFFATMAIFVSFTSKSGNLPHMVARLWAKSLLAASGIKVTVKAIPTLILPDLTSTCPTI